MSVIHAESKINLHSPPKQHSLLFLLTLLCNGSMRLKNIFLQEKRIGNILKRELSWEGETVFPTFFTLAFEQFKKQFITRMVGLIIYNKE